MGKKSILRLIRELRAAQMQDLVVFFDICTEAIAEATIDEVMGEATPMKVQHYLKVALDEDVSYDKAKQLKDYLVLNFEAIERVVLTMRTEAGVSVWPELKIYTKGKPRR